MSSSFLNPSVTPETAFATRLRARPWNLRSSSSSRESFATSAPASCEKRIPGGVGWRSLPFGPWTSTASGAILTVTPFGIGIGFLPIRDISCPSFRVSASARGATARPRRSAHARRRARFRVPLPHVAEHFAADAGFAGCAPGHHTARRRQDARAQAAKHMRHVLHTEVHPASRTTDALEPGDDLFTPRPVLQENANELPRLPAFPLGRFFHEAIALDVALVLENARDLRLELAGRH